MEKLAAGKKVGAIDPSRPRSSAPEDDPGAGLGQVTKWRGDKTKAKETISVGSFLRGPGAHGGRAIDINGFDWTGANGPAQVEEALRALPAGLLRHRPALPGPVLPEGRVARTNARRTPATRPADITEASLQKFVGTRYTSTYKDGAWEDKEAGGQAISRLKSSTLKAAIAELNGKGYKIYVFPDNHNHIHIQNP